MKDIQSHIIAGVTTVVILLLLLLLLFKLTISAPIQMEDEGIVITFGYSDEGGGVPDALLLMPMAQSEVPPAAPAPLPQLPSDNELIVQEDEESLALAEQNEQEQKRKALEQELIRKQREAEAAQAEAERIARERALAEQRAKEQEAIDKANQLAALFGQSNSAEGANADDASIEPSPSGKGNPVGKNFGIVDGNMWSLQGRKVKSMPKPSSDFNQQGKVVVNIRVDKEGNVVLASIGDGTNISDSYTQQLALEAARKAKFTAGEREQVGSITYNFKLN